MSSTLVRLRLRPYNNQLTVVSKGKSTLFVKQYQLYQNVDESGRSRRWAVLSGFNDESPSLVTHNIELVSRELRNNGVEDIVSLPAANMTAIRGALFDVSRKMKNGDQLLFYFTGTARYDYSLEDIRLANSPDQEIRTVTNESSLTSLLSYIATLKIPSLAILIDALPSAAVDDPAGQSRQAFVETTDQAQATMLADQASSPWLAPLQRQRSLELVISNRFVGVSQREALQDLTVELLKPWGTVTKESSCLSLGEMYADAKKSREWRQTAVAQPLYFSTTRDTSAFCFTSPVNGQLSVGATSVDDDTDFANVSAQIPVESPANKITVSVNGTTVSEEDLVRTNAVRGMSQYSHRLPISPGLNMVRISTGIGPRTLYSGSALIKNPGTAPELMWDSEKPAPRVRLVRGPGTSAGEFGAASDGLAHLVYVADRVANLQFVVHDVESLNTDYELQNNGVTIVRHHVRRRHAADAFNVLVNVPLVEGNNNVFLRVGRPAQCTMLRMRLVYKKPQRVVAVVAGLSEYKDRSQVTSLRYGASDAALMRLLLLKHTSILPQDIVLLTNSKGTKDNIRNALSSKLVDMLRAQGGNTTLSEIADATLFFYFAGYGATIPQSGERCLLPYDVDVARLGETCLSTVRLDEYLGEGPWKNAVVVADASYGGKAGLIGDTDNDKANYIRSRTWTDSYSSDESWRATAGLVDDRVLFVASSTNEAAIETGDSEHGLLTASLQRSFEENKALRIGYSFAPLADVFTNARDLAVKLTDGQQNPIVKGSLSEPFMFRTVGLPEFRSEWSPIFSGLRRDVLSLKLPDSVQVERLEGSIDKGIDLYPDEPLPQIAKIAVARYRAILCRERDGQLCATILSDSTAPLDKVLAAVQKNFAISKSSADKELLYGTLITQARLQGETGRIDAGLSACNQALGLFPDSVGAKLTLASLLMEKGDFNHLSAVLDQILKGALQKGSAVSASLTPEEVGQIIVWRFISLTEIGKKNQAKLLLSVYGNRRAHSTKMKKWFYGTKLSERIFPERYRLRKEGDLDDDSEWWVYLANYMLGKRQDDDLLAFEKEAINRRSIDQGPGDCMVNFYMGMKHLHDNDRGKALELFRIATQTNRFEYPEWWVAHSASLGAIR